MRSRIYLCFYQKLKRQCRQVRLYIVGTQLN